MTSKRHSKSVRSGLALGCGLVLLTLSACSHLERPETSPQACVTETLDASFFQDCAFVCVDIQPGVRKQLTDDEIPKSWRRNGFTAKDVNAANDYAFDTAYPNARKVADACRRLKLPMIFIHWGHRFPDAMDLDPEVRSWFSKENGADPTQWGGHISDPSSRPAEILGVREGEYVIPKTAQDAFPSSCLHYVLRNLGVKNIVFVGGHTGACLGKTAKSAIRNGYATLCIHDATFNAFESTRLNDIIDIKYNYSITAEEFILLVDANSLKERE